MNREDIKAVLRKQGYTLSHAARELGVSKQALTMVLSGKRSSRIEAWIAEQLAMRPEEVWPERYSQDEAGES
ncbi:MAG: helix-turn-helix domain-containing protein [Cyanobacteriota bacterium]|nr:helix-turn-helix domain-containing protein [Cyanobacteriota bacterium]